MVIVKRLQRGVHAVAARRAGTRQGMLSHITFPYLIPALLIIRISFRQRALAYLAPYHYADTAKAFQSAGSVTQPPPPVPVKKIADGEAGDRCEGKSGRDGESSPDSLACGMRAAIGEHSAGLGICVIVAVPGRIAASAPCLPIGVSVY